MSSELEKFVGSWSLDSTDNFDNYMKAIGVGFIMRKVGNSISPTQHISIEGDTVIIKTTSTFKNTEIRFQLDKEFTEVTADNCTVKSTVELDGNVLVHKQIKEDGKVRTIMKRYLDTDDLLVMVLETKNDKGEDVVCTRKYKKVKEM